MYFACAVRELMIAAKVQRRVSQECKKSIECWRTKKTAQQTAAIPAEVNDQEKWAKL
jgi:hypothetical protein